MAGFSPEPHFESRIHMSNRLYVGNLSFDTSSESIREAFSAFGDITDVHVASDRETGRSRGFGFVTMGSADQAATAIAQMNGALLDGRPLRVNEAEERPNRGGGGGGPRGGGGRNRWLSAEHRRAEEARRRVPFGVARRFRFVSQRARQIGQPVRLDSARKFDHARRSASFRESGSLPST